MLQKIVKSVEGVIFGFFFFWKTKQKPEKLLNSIESYWYDSSIWYGNIIKQFNRYMPFVIHVLISVSYPAKEKSTRQRLFGMNVEL